MRFSVRSNLVAHGKRRHSKVRPSVSSLSSQLIELFFEKKVLTPIVWSARGASGSPGLDSEEEGEEEDEEGTQLKIIQFYLKFNFAYAEVPPPKSRRRASASVAIQTLRHPCPVTSCDKRFATRSEAILHSKKVPIDC